MEDFVPFEIAKKLKEKGFPQDIDTYNYSNYYLFDGLRHCSTLYNHKIWWSYDNKENLYFAPTISQVLKWLREEKKYHIEFVSNACGYLFIISDVPSEGGTDRYCSDYSGPNDGGTWDKYEDCAIAGIEYVLDNLI